MQDSRLLILCTVHHFKEVKEYRFTQSGAFQVSLQHTWKSFSHFILGYESFVHVITINIKKADWKLEVVCSIKLYSTS